MQTTRPNDIWRRFHAASLVLWTLACAVQPDGSLGQQCFSLPQCPAVGLPWSNWRPAACQVGEYSRLQPQLSPLAVSSLLDRDRGWVLHWMSLVLQPVRGPRVAHLALGSMQPLGSCQVQQGHSGTALFLELHWCCAPLLGVQRASRSACTASQDWRRHQRHVQV